MLFLVFSIHLSIRHQQAAHMAPPWHAGAGGHGRRQSQPSSACRQRPTEARAYGKACCQGLQNGPFRLAKRPMQHCQTAHIARRNGPFCNGRAASHSTRCRPGCLPKQACGRQDRTPPRLRKQSAQGRDHPQQATIQSKRCRASRRNTLKKSESIYIISQYHCNCLLQDAKGREPHRNEATAAATQRSGWNAPGHGRCHACKDKYHITIIASLDARISQHIAYKPHNPQNRTIIMPDKGHKSQQQARATGVSAELPSRVHAALGNWAEGRGRTERQAKWRKTGKALASMARISKQRQGGTTARRLQKQLACCHAQALQLPDMHAAYTSATILKKAPARQGNAAPILHAYKARQQHHAGGGHARHAARRIPCGLHLPMHMKKPAPWLLCFQATGPANAYQRFFKNSISTILSEFLPFTALSLFRASSSCTAPKASFVVLAPRERIVMVLVFGAFFSGMCM